MTIKILRVFSIILIFVLSACSDEVSDGITCSEQSSHSRCTEIFKGYETLRNSSIFLEEVWGSFSTPQLIQISEGFSALSLTSRKSAPCISFASKSYANYLRTMAAAYSSREPVSDIYVADATHTLNSLKLDNCVWELGESSIILADQVLSNQFQPNNSGDLKVFIYKLNRSSVDNNLACSIIVGNILLPYSDKMRNRSDLIRQVTAECLHEHRVAAAKMDKIQNQELINIIKSQFSTIDRNLSGNRLFNERW